MTKKKRDLIIKGIEEYTGKTVEKLKTYRDPKVNGTYALKAIMNDNKVLDFLICGGYVEEWTPECISDNLEECEFESWPPKSGSLQFC